LRGSERLFTIVEKLSRQTMNLTQVAEAVELPKSTALRFLRDLEEAGWVARDTAGVYSLGATVVGLAAQYIAQNELVAAATPAMRELREQIDETVSLSRRVGLIRVCVQEFPSKKPLRLVLGVGERGPLHAGASGILLYAHMPDGERRRIADAGFERYTKRTLVDFDALEKEAERVRRQGWAITRGSRTEGGVAIAVPLSDPGDDGEISALGLFGPQLRCSTNAERDHWLRSLLQTAESIQTAMTSFR
jgi:IclR family acetate operon transcriptional repressor